MDVITGKNSVKAALSAQKKIDKIIMDKVRNSIDLIEIIDIAEKRSITIEFASKAKLDVLAEFANHQGVVALAEPFEYVGIKDILNLAKSKNEPPLIIVLDHIEDPHNFGAVLRTAEAGGVHGVIIPNKRAAAMTQAVYRTSAGAAFYVPIAMVSNIANTLDVLKKNGLWVYCLDAAGNNMYFENLTGSIVLVLGSEGFGVSDLVRKKCDFTVAIPMFGQLTSLNASVSAGVAIYEIIRQRKINEK